MVDCRTCLIKANPKNCVDVEAVVIDQINVLQAIQELTCLEVSINDVLPKCICKKCFKQLQSTTIFRRKIINSYNHLMRQGDGLKIENISVKSKVEAETENTANIDYKGYLFTPIYSTSIPNNSSVIDKRQTRNEIVALNNVSEHMKCENTVSVQKEIIKKDESLETHKWPELPKLVQRRRKTRSRFKLKLKPSLEIIVNNVQVPGSDNKRVGEIESQQCALKELSEDVKLSLQKITQNSERRTETEKPISSSKRLTISQTCTVCGLTFKGKKRYTRHMKIHTSAIPALQYVCSICPKRYPKKEYLLVHTRSHTGEKPYHCDICDKNFSQFSTYYVHKRRLHDKVVQGTCSYCGKMFVDKSELDVHIKMWHTGERPYLCEFCSATFVCNRTLQRHRKEIHSEKKPCQKCGIMLGDYALRKHLVRHQVLEEGLKVVRKKYTCEYCKTVMNFTSRRRHLEKQHGIKLHGRGDDCTKVPIKGTDEDSKNLLIS